MTAVTLRRLESHTRAMGAVSYLKDRLTNALTGAGTSRDARRANAYVSRALTQHEIAHAYSGSGLMRKVVQIPALDMVREWRDWSGLDDDQASALYDEEKRLAIRQKVLQVETLRRMGGGALILGLPGLPEQPAPSTVGRKTLAFIHVVSRWHLSFNQLSDDATTDGFGEPAMWRMNTADGQKDIHPSRVIPFRADTSAAMILPSVGSDDAFWGESAIAQVLDAVQDSDTARAAFASLLHKARLLRIGIPNLVELAGEPEGEGQVMARLALLATAESIHNATIFDAGDPEHGKGGEKIEDATYNFAGAKDIINALNEFVAAISDIPATRLLGRAPEGLNSSGDSQQADWQKKIRAMQTLDLAPCLDRLDRYLVPSAIGSFPEAASYEFAPLGTETDTERATRFKTEAEAVQIVANMGVVPEEVLSRGAQSWLVAEGYLPELEAALADIPDEERFGLAAGPEEIDNDGKERDPSSAGVGGEMEAPPRRAANDAAPRPLYVHRKLLNAAELIKWAKAQGFKTTLPASDMHVTLLYSKSAVDWMKMGGESWGSDGKGEFIVPPGGARLVEPLGDQGAIVLLFNSSSLAWRHEEMVRNGASHDFDEYQPHVTISYEAGDVDLSKIEPFRGELRFGPEMFEPLDEDWKTKIEER